MIAAFLCEPVSHKGIQEGEECLLSNSHQATPLPIWIGDVTMQGGMLTPDSWFAHERIDFNEPRCLYFPIHRRALNSFVWDIWFPLISNNLWCSNYLPLCWKLLYNPISPNTPKHPKHTPPQSRFSGLLERLLSRLEVLRIPTERNSSLLSGYDCIF